MNDTALAFPTDEAIRYSVGHSTLGPTIIAATATGIRAIELGDTGDAVVAQLGERFPDRQLRRDDEGLRQWLAAVIETVDGDRQRLEAVVATIDGARPWLDAPLDYQGTPFQRRVWERLCSIPLGTTMTYSALATELGDPDALRAVAGACAANPLAVIIPCHRVLRSDGGLGGYRWGIERKRALLMREKALGELDFG